MGCQPGWGMGMAHNYQGSGIPGQPWGTGSWSRWAGRLGRRLRGAVSGKLAGVAVVTAAAAAAAVGTGKMGDTWGDGGVGRAASSGALPAGQRPKPSPLGRSMGVGAWGRGPFH